jgi:hypothetical protein
MRVFSSSGEQAADFTLGGGVIPKVGAHLERRLASFRGTGQEVDLGPVLGPHVANIHVAALELDAHGRLEGMAEIRLAGAVRGGHEARVDWVGLARENHAPSLGLRLDPSKSDPEACRAWPAGMPENAILV